MLNMMILRKILLIISNLILIDYIAKDTSLSNLTIQPTIMLDFCFDRSHRSIMLNLSQKQNDLIFTSATTFQINYYSIRIKLSSDTNHNNFDYFYFSVSGNEYQTWL